MLDKDCQPPATAKLPRHRFDPPAAAPWTFLVPDTVMHGNASATLASGSLGASGVRQARLPARASRRARGSPRSPALPDDAV